MAYTGPLSACKHSVRFRTKHWLQAFFLHSCGWIKTCDDSTETHSFSNGWNWPCAHDWRIKACLSPGNDACHWF